MGYAQNEVSSAYNFFTGSEFDKLQTLSLTNVNFADRLMNEKSAMSSTAYSAESMFKNCYFDALTSIGFTGAKFAAIHMISSLSGRYCFTASRTFEGATFSVMSSLSLANAIFAVDTVGEEPMN
jgi:hypothetical protein